MLRTRYSLEASNYFFDNGDLTFDLRVTIEGLVFSDGIPTAGNHYVAPDGTHVWGIMNHNVLYSIRENILYIEAVIPD